MKFNVYANCLESDKNYLELIVSGDESLLTLQGIIYNKHNAELDVQTTLENYLDHAWLDNHILEIENDYKIMSTPLAELLSDYAIYEMVVPTTSESNQF